MSAEPVDIQAKQFARLKSIREQIASLKLEESELEKALIDQMRVNRLELPGLPVIERQWSKKRTEWQHSALQSALIRKIRDGELKPDRVVSDDGEIFEEDTVAFVARVFTESANPSWRTGWLKDHHITPGDYCTEAKATASIKFIESN